MTNEQDPGAALAAPYDAHRASLEKERATALAALPRIEAFTILSDADVLVANELVKMAKDAQESLEARRTALTKPIDAQKKKIQALFVPVRQVHEQIEGVLKSKIGAYTLAQRQAEEEKMRAAAKAAASGDVASAAAIVTTMGATIEPKGQSVKEVWTFSVVDEGAVPRALMSPDPEKVLALVPKFGAPPEVPGIVWSKGASVTVRR